ncbi:hypothetical protein SESBI_15721 [Sesbania bispinosa]|nr:hypothetical protein SESBI_15721 [Sesbania bispinosa]
MNVLEDSSPLEAQAFNYLSFGFLTLLNNFWTWLAVSLWRIPPPQPELLPPSDDRTDPAPEVSESVAVSGPNGTADVINGVTKGKFTLYYENDINRWECESEEALTEEWELGRWEWWDSWERLLKLRIGENENGWYTCQDLTALNGDVVKFWDGAVFMYGKI